MLDEQIIDQFRVPPDVDVKLKKYDTAWAGTDEMQKLSKDELKDEADEILERNRAELTKSQTRLYADNRYAVLVVLQAMDGAGKDGTIKHVMSGVNPQGCQVFSFKKPSEEELDHTFLWRCSRCLPERGRIGIFNRSYYEDVLVVKVHPELLGPLPHNRKVGGKFWKGRYKDINAFERHLVRNGTRVLKFFLYMSKDEQKKRLLERIDNPEKNWKFSPQDVVERGFWNQYINAYEDALSATSTKWAPWYVIPADHKWVARAIVAEILTAEIQKLKLKFPKLPDEEQNSLAAARLQLLSEK